LTRELAEHIEWPRSTGLTIELTNCSLWKTTTKKYFFFGGDII